MSLGKEKVIQVAQVGGKSQFRSFLSGPLIRANNFSRLSRLGIIRDADTGAKSAFQSLHGDLTAAALPPPSQAWAWEPPRQGKLNVSVAILPDMNSGGSLEELCLRSLEVEPELSCVNDYVECVTSRSSPVSAHHIAKAKIHTYLAVGARPKKGGNHGRGVTNRRKPGLRLGEAAEQGVWNWADPAFQQIKNWLLGLA